MPRVVPLVKSSGNFPRPAPRRRIFQSAQRRVCRTTWLWHHSVAQRGPQLAPDQNLSAAGIVLAVRHPAWGFWRGSFLVCGYWSGGNGEAALLDQLIGLDGCPVTLVVAGGNFVCSARRMPLGARKPARRNLRTCCVLRHAVMPTPRCRGCCPSCSRSARRCRCAGHAELRGNPGRRCSR